LYDATADLTVDTTGRTPEEVAAALREALTTVRVDLGERSYTVHIDTGLLARAGSLLEESGLAPTRRALVTNPRVWELHGGRWPADPRRVVFPVPAGERNKSLRQASHLYRAWMEAGLDRRSAVVAFGGGQVGDLAGFVAATYMRGLDFVQAPTTLLAQVDSSVGGKVAVNHPAAKNLVGAFHQPRLVIADLDTLATLPAAEFREGLAEIVKHAVIRDARMLEYLETHRTEIRERNPAALRHLVRRNVEIKAAVVSADEREAGLRAILNFGHTVGHALEILTRHRLRHGRAISIGMAVAARVAERTGRLAPAEAKRLVRLLRGFGLPTSPPALAPEEMLRVMRADKKAIAGRLRLVLPVALGRVEVVDDVPESLLLEVLGGSD
jgi:3-dehydroquinate synthase